MTKKKFLKYIKRVGIAASVLLNVILLGSSGQTFSARNYLWKKQGRLNIVWLIDHLIFWDNDHCFYSYVYWFTGKNFRQVGVFGKFSVDKADTVVYSDNERYDGEYYANFD